MSGNIRPEWPPATQIKTCSRRQNAGLWGSQVWGSRGWGESTTPGLAPDGFLCPQEAGTCPSGAPKGLWPCQSALPRPARQSLSFSLLPAGLPVLDANDPEGESVSSTRLTPKFSPRTLASWLLSWIHVLFFLSLQIKTALSTMVRACAPLMAIPHLHPPPTILCKGSHTAWVGVRCA